MRKMTILLLMTVLMSVGAVAHAALTDNSNGTVTDSRTGLIWQQGEPGGMTWGSALSYCEGLNLGGSTSWRLPNIKELESLTDDTRWNPAIDTSKFPSAIASFYWSSTSAAGYPSYAWGVHLGYNNVIYASVYADDKSSTFYVRCVRGGQSGSFGNLPSHWVGSVTITSDKNMVAVGRPHIGSEVASYDGFPAGALSAYLPMLFKNAWGSYDSAFYVQNVNAANTANLVINYYDSTGSLSCTVNDTVAALAANGYWVPGQSCLSDGWVGGVVVTSDQPIVAVGRPHIGDQVTTYNGFTSGSLSSYLPMLFKAAFGGSYNSAFYIQNTEESAAAVTIKFYDSSGALTCTRDDTIPALSTLGLWLPSLTCVP